MAIAMERRQTAFRLSSELLDKLKEAAGRENRSLNNYVESVLTEDRKSVGRESNPNKLTLAAMKEARDNNKLESLDANNLESIIESL